MKVVVIVSADGEWNAVRTLLAPSQLHQSRVGEWFEAPAGPRTVTFFHGGWGRVSAAATTQYVIDHFQPELLVNLGTCGGFEGRIARGTVVLVEKTVIYDILEQMTDPESAIGFYSTRLDLDWLRGSLPSPVTRGLMVSGDRDIVPSEIPELVNKYQAVAADWESGAIAWVASRNGRPILILRGVSDLVGRSGGEAYGNYKLFMDRTTEIMKNLVDVLPAWLDAVEGVQQVPAQ